MIVPEEVSQQRFAHCKTCEKFIKLTQMCNVCGCFMPVKVKLQPVSCPIQKWSHYGDAK
jgi:hypothetical protein